MPRQRVYPIASGLPWGEDLLYKRLWLRSEKLLSVIKSLVHELVSMPKKSAELRAEDGLTECACSTNSSETSGYANPSHYSEPIKLSISSSHRGVVHEALPRRYLWEWGLLAFEGWNHDHWPSLHRLLSRLDCSEEALRPRPYICDRVSLEAQDSHPSPQDPNSHRLFLVNDHGRKSYKQLKLLSTPPKRTDMDWSWILENNCQYSEKSNLSLWWKYSQN